MTTHLEPGVCQAKTKIVIPFYLAHYVLKKNFKAKKKTWGIGRKMSCLKYVKLPQILDCIVISCSKLVCVIESQMHAYEMIFLTSGNQKVLTHTSTHTLIRKGGSATCDKKFKSLLCKAV